jgi:hypothetical protein
VVCGFFRPIVSALQYGENHVPAPHDRVDEVPQMHALMRARPLAALVSAGASGLYATGYAATPAN